MPPFVAAIAPFYGDDLAGGSIRIAIANGMGGSTVSVKNYISGRQHPRLGAMSILRAMTPAAPALAMLDHRARSSTSHAQASPPKATA
jgi:hypothetical protein